MDVDHAYMPAPKSLSPVRRPSWIDFYISAQSMPLPSRQVRAKLGSSPCTPLVTIRYWTLLTSASTHPSYCRPDAHTSLLVSKEIIRD
jgi:hypothetical protein